MAYIDALNDRVTISTTTYTKNALLEETKIESVLYNDIPCRLMRGKSSIKKNTEGAQESFVNEWLIQVQPTNNLANRGDKAVVNNQTYLIISKHEIKGNSTAIHHVVYYLQEYNG